MKKLLVFLLILMIPFLAGRSLAQAGATASPASDSLEVEKLKLEIERLKLENQRLQLEIKTLQLGNPNTPSPDNTPGMPAATPTPNPQQTDKDKKHYAADMAVKAEALAKENAQNEKLVVLDFTNGEIWYKGVRSKMNDFKLFCSDQNWEMHPEFIKNDINGDSLYRYRHQNMYLDRYDMQSRGVFGFEAPEKDGDFTFLTPEMVTDKSGYGDIRNHFETAYFTFDKEDKDKGFKILRFKHTADFLGFDDVILVWFDKKGNFVKLRWGMLDKK
ncbi:MAG TPA: hypothetical protein VJ873_01315 [bacterium]|nr:hypothetical protein [bacterium]